MIAALGCLNQVPSEVSAARVNPVEPTGHLTPTVAVRAANTPTHSPAVAYWAARGIVFEGPWQEDEIDLVTEVLARFADRLGEARFLALIRKAVRAGTDGQRQTLTFKRDVDVDGMVGSWAFYLGQITIYEGLFDPEYLAANYPLRFDLHLAHAPDGADSSPMFTVAHELGHVLVDGMREEHVSNGLAPTVIEDRYVDDIYLDYWVHPLNVPKESIVSEVALWVLEVRRPPDVRAFHHDVLVPALRGE
jgi:hypothetical protein